MAIAAAAAWLAERESRSAGLAVGVVLGMGAVLGLSLPADDDLSPGYRRLSSWIGWTYWSAWSVAFYPQVFSNYVRRSVVGMSFDFLALNVLGFGCYSTYNGLMYWNAEVRREYDLQHDGGSPVRLNDVMFSLHALTMCCVVAWQALAYDRGGQTVSRRTWAFIGCALAAIAGYGAVVAFGPHEEHSLLDWALFVSSVKVVISFLKSFPQLHLNWTRKSTEGWPVQRVILDLTGGVLSLLQLLLDAADEGDFSAVAGDFAKLGLGAIAVAFDWLFLVQHYVLYPRPARYVSVEDDVGPGAGSVQA